MKRSLLSTTLFSCLALAALAQESPLLDASGEWLESDDVRVQTAWTSIQAPLAVDLMISGRVDYMGHRIEYQPNAPIDPFGEAVQIDETQVGLQLDLEKRRNRHQITASLNAYDGFRNFSSIWIDRYYRQQYGQGGIPGVSYESPEPKGFGTNFSYRYEAIPAAGYLTVSIGFLRDTVAPGYEIEDLGTSFELVQGEDSLNTWTGSIEWEGVVNSRARTRQTIRITNTTERDPRYGWSGALNFLISDKWISRTNGAYATEDPDFEAWSLSQTIECAIHPRWSLSATFRYYKDTGQIEAANLISSAAPELSTRQAFIALRYESEDQLSSYSFSVGPYETHYGQTGIGTERFFYLYQDRDWLWARISGRIVF
ncbi:hypothetical protein G0Q06_12715 [Puniceicoccales bacterium CK1056]|uniref:Beta-barrel porin 2 n=1 Tax=Oceanipulchritudo coccoides TaxID=2706888 RepID=A0A6B2M6N0_9BACT|nr:hypothetical protein [Oceanipulchritudo coccoides]NDV63320.1 hypothetical protein [Oceanipulchritudo coccoides]